MERSYLSVEPSSLLTKDLGGFKVGLNVIRLGALSLKFWNGLKVSKQFREPDLQPFDDYGRWALSRLLF